MARGIFSFAFADSCGFFVFNPSTPPSLEKNNDISLHQLLNQRKDVLLAIMRIFNPFISSTSHQGASLYSLFQFPVALMSKDKGAATLQREAAKIW